MDSPTACSLLASAERQLLLRTLLEGDGPETVPELARAVAETPRTEFERPEPARIALQHVHLPTLADHGVVEHDDGLVAPTPEAHALGELLDAAAAFDRSWADDAVDRQPGFGRS